MNLFIELIADQSVLDAINLAPTTIIPQREGGERGFRCFQRLDVCIR